MRIVIPIHSFEPGGVERVALNLAEAWQAAGEEVVVVLGRRDGAMAATAPALDYELRPEPVPTAAFETLWMIWRLWRYLAVHPADVVFCAGNTYAVVGAAMRLLLGRRCPPMVIKISNDLARRDLPGPARWGYRQWLRLQGRLFARIVGMAPPMRAEIAEAMAAPDPRIAIVEDPSLGKGQYDRLACIARTGHIPPAPRYVAVGRLASQKNVALMLRAFARGAPEGAMLTVVGEGPDRAMLERLASSLGLAGRVSFAGHQADTAPFYAAADALLLSSDYEGVPAVVIEALAAGLPVIGTDCSVSMTGLLGEGRFGLLSAPGDEAGLARSIAALPDFAFAPAEARESVGRFSIAVAAPRYLDVFAEAADASPQRIAEA